MKRKILNLLVLLGVGSLFATPIQAQDQETAVKDVVVIEPLSGQTYQKAIAEIGRIEFSAEEFCLVDHQGTILGCEERSKTRTIIFGSADETGMTTSQISNTITLYPNPAVDVVHISGLEDNAVVRIYTTSGQLVSSATLSGQDIVLPLSHLATGTYYLQVQTQVFKLIKR